MVTQDSPIQEIAADVRQHLKREFPKCRFSVTIKTYSMGQSLTVALMSAPFPAFAKDHDCNGNPMHSAHAQLNQYQLPQEYWKNEGICNGAYLTPEIWAVMERAAEIANTHNYDHSDPMSDYSNVNYHLHIEIGKWDKPFVIA